MNLSDLSAITAEQDAGRWHELTHPVTGEGTGVKLLVAGPDGNVQHAAMARLQDGMRAGKAKRKDALYLECLADFVLDIDASEDGQKVPFSRDLALRTVSAGEWVRKQVEAFAGDRRAFVQGDA